MTTGVLANGFTGIQHVATILYNTVQQAMPVKELLQYSVAWAVGNMPDAAVEGAAVAIEWNSTAVIGIAVGGSVGGLAVTGLGVYGLYRGIKWCCTDDSNLIRDVGGNGFQRLHEQTRSNIPSSYDGTSYSVDSAVGSENDPLLRANKQDAGQKEHIVVLLDGDGSKSVAENDGSQNKMNNVATCNAGLGDDDTKSNNS